MTAWVYLDHNLYLEVNIVYSSTPDSEFEYVIFLNLAKSWSATFFSAW